MIIGVLKETQKGDNRVSITPKIAQQLIEKGFEIRVEENAGVNSSYKNSDYSKSGAGISSKEDLFKNADVLIKINPFDNKELKGLKKGQIIAFPPYWTHKHMVNAPTNGTYRYTINTWLFE